MSCTRYLTTAVEHGTQMVNKLMYRSKQRGFLELDLLVGLWAEKELKHMSMESLNSFSTVLDQVRETFANKCAFDVHPVWKHG